MTDTSSATSRPLAKTKRPAPKSVLELLDACYSEGGRRLQVAGRDLEHIRVSDHDHVAETTLVSSRAPEDATLGAPLRMLLVMSLVTSKKKDLRDRVLELARIALRAHPIFELHQDVVAEGDGPGCEQVKRLALNYATQASISDAQRERLASNAPTAIALYRALSGDWSLERFVQELGIVWRRESMEDWSDRRRASVLAGSRDADALAVLAGLHRDTAKQLERDLRGTRVLAESRKRDLATAEADIRRLQQELDTQAARAAELEHELHDRTQQIAAERAGRTADRSHHVDDYESLRTQVVRRLSIQTELLADGLHALRAERYRVADEFVDRAIIAIENELTELRNQGDGA